MAGRNKNKPDRPVIRFRNDGTFWIDTKDQEWKEFLMECCYGEDGLELFCKYFLAGSFKKPFTKERREFARHLSNTALPHVWGMAYRGFGKTTLVWAEIIRRICFRLNCFIVYCSSELSLAERRTENIRSTLTKNRLIRKFFGSMTPTYDDGMREVFGTKSWKLTDPMTGKPFCMVVPKSDNTTVNGLVEEIMDVQQRPDLIVCDDIADRLRINDENYRIKQRDWVFGTLFPCVENEQQPDPVSHTWPVKRGYRAPYNNMIIDTCKHSDAVIESAAKDPEWIGNRYPLAADIGDGNLASMVDHLTNEQVQAMYDRFRRIGREDRFYKEYVCVSQAASDAMFPTTHQYYRESELNLNNDPYITRFIVVDPARTQNPKSDYTAMLAVAVDCRAAKVYLRGMIHARLGYEEIGERLIAFAKQTNSDVLAVEDNGLNDFIRGPLEKFAQKSGLWVHWIWLPAGRKHIEAQGEFRSIKEARGSAALWLYRAFGKTHPRGHVWHEESMRNGPLESQMLSFPECSSWDAMDCLGYIDYVMRDLHLQFDEQREVDHEDKDFRSEYDMFGDWIHSGAWQTAC